MAPQEVLSAPDGSGLAPQEILSAPDGSGLAPDGLLSAPDGSGLAPQEVLSAPDGSGGMLDRFETFFTVGAMTKNERQKITYFVLLTKYT